MNLSIVKLDKYLFRITIFVLPIDNRCEWIKGKGKGKSAEKLVASCDNFKRLSIVMSVCLSWLVFYDVPYLLTLMLSSSLLVDLLHRQGYYSEFNYLVINLFHSSRWKIDVIIGPNLIYNNICGILIYRYIIAFSHSCIYKNSITYSK